ncbi:hypothetical protein O181_097251 [Austropuccinia psidii MF-1]|uniref:Uncharacterized protein n=1 Tax=Austropuccinia psidii MF-1 TaxID=1389203 RepID=A0A9Q3J914_9BASI|nr:hypothetical protein [Austropuccinia psidii MF-1]
MIVEEKYSILSSSEESIHPLIDRKSKGKETEDCEAIATIKEELKKMRRNLDMAIEDPEKWLAPKSSGMNTEDGGESPQKKFKMDLKQNPQ